MKNKTAENPGILGAQAITFVLAKWKRNPNLTKRQIGVWSSWSEDTEENNQPLSKSEIKRMKKTLKR